MNGSVRLAFAGAAATINRRGAEPVSWSVDGKELLWSADPAFWPRSSPILFPIVGRARGGVIRVDRRSYPMGVHGFAASLHFDVLEESAEAVTLIARDNPTTFGQFPFPFRLEVRYRLQRSTLSAAFQVVNPGKGNLPYALGFHPGFAWPFSAGGRRDEYIVRFECDEEPTVPVITRDGLFANARRPVPLRGGVLPLRNGIMDQEALCFINARSRTIGFVAPDGAAIRMTAENFPHFALWSKPAAPFLCLEAWTGYGDPDDFVGDIDDKPSMLRLAPGDGVRHALEFVYEERST